MILEKLYRLKLQNSAQLQTVLALYDQETARNKGKPNSSSQLKTAVKFHIEQNAENSKLHGPKRCCGWRISHEESKRKESLHREESGRVFFLVESTLTMFQRRTHAVSVMTQRPLATVAAIRNEKDDRLLPHSKRD